MNRKYVPFIYSPMQSLFQEIRTRVPPPESIFAEFLSSRSYRNQTGRRCLYPQIPANEQTNS